MSDIIDRDHGVITNGVCAATFSPLVLIPTNKYSGRRRLFKLGCDFTFILDYPGGKHTVNVPKDYETDLATIPLICQVVLGGRDDFAEEAVIHDFLCSNHMPSWYANSTMRSLMHILKRPVWKQRAVFWALMLFGYGSLVGRCVNKFFYRSK